MIHAAAKDEPYSCFVAEDRVLPFMAMPDAVKALLNLAAAPQEKLTKSVYNVTSFSLSAEDFCEHVKQYFPNAQITYKPDLKRQGIVDSWPMDIDDTAARKDWNWSPDFGLDSAFKDYLIPNIKKMYEI